MSSAAPASRGTAWSGCSTSWAGSTSTCRAGPPPPTTCHDLAAARADEGRGGGALRPQPPAGHGAVVRPRLRLRLPLDGDVSLPMVLGLVLPRGGPLPRRPRAGADRDAEPARQRAARRLRGPRHVLAAREVRGHAVDVRDRLPHALPERLHAAPAPRR